MSVVQMDSLAKIVCHKYVIEMLGGINHVCDR